MSRPEPAGAGLLTERLRSNGFAVESVSPWAEVDLSMLWCSPRPPAAHRFFDAYAEAAGLEAGWRERMPLLHLRELLSTIAHGDDDWGAAGAVRNHQTLLISRCCRSAS